MKMREGKEQKKWNCPWTVKEDNIDSGGLCSIQPLT